MYFVHTNTHMVPVRHTYDLESFTNFLRLPLHHFPLSQISHFTHDNASCTDENHKNDQRPYIHITFGESINRHPFTIPVQ